jgi:hypothetical protein
MPALFHMVPVFAFISPLRYEDIGSTGAKVDEYVSFQTDLRAKLGGKSVSCIAPTNLLTKAN